MLSLHNAHQNLGKVQLKALASKNFIVVQMMEFVNALSHKVTGLFS